MGFGIVRNQSFCSCRNDGSNFAGPIVIENRRESYLTKEVTQRNWGALAVVSEQAEHGVADNKVAGAIHNEIPWATALQQQCALSLRLGPPGCFPHIRHRLSWTGAISPVHLGFSGTCI